MHYESVIGLEVHAQLNTKSKLFCRCSTIYGAEPNVNTCEVCQAHPGTLPALNRSALEKTIQSGISLDCQINYYSKFDRKSYFYPDLPKAYQISQYDFPLCKNGRLEIDVNGIYKTIRINRIHLEEDAGRLIHSEVNESYVDLNRAGVPLIEIVSEPDLKTSEETYKYLTSLKQILKYIEVSDCNMEQGSLRCDANVSLRVKGSKELGTKIEIKNLNSFKNVQKAVDYEIRRQSQLLDTKKTIEQETRLYNADLDRTELMRTKESAHNYRYFPEPDLLPINLQQGYVEKLRNQLPELPRQKLNRFIQSYGLSKKTSNELIDNKQIANFYEEALNVYSKNANKLANWVMVELMGALNETNKDISEIKIVPKELALIIKYIDDEKISGKMAKTIFESLVKNGGTVDSLMKKLNLKLITDHQKLNVFIDKVIKENQPAVQSFHTGKNKALGSLIGSIMKLSNGQADPSILSKLLIEKLNHLKD